MRTQQISPSVYALSVTPNDASDLPIYSLKGWSVNADGYVKVFLQNHTNSDVPITVFAKAGARYPDVLRRVFATGTTATGIIIYS